MKKALLTGVFSGVAWWGVAANASDDLASACDLNPPESTFESVCVAQLRSTTPGSADAVWAGSSYNVKVLIEIRYAIDNFKGSLWYPMLAMAGDPSVSGDVAAELSQDDSYTEFKINGTVPAGTKLLLTVPVLAPGYIDEFDRTVSDWWKVWTGLHAEFESDGARFFRFYGGLRFDVFGGAHGQNHQPYLYPGQVFDIWEADLNGSSWTWGGEPRLYAADFDSDDLFFSIKEVGSDVISFNENGGFQFMNPDAVRAMADENNQLLLHVTATDGRGGASVETEVTLRLPKMVEVNAAPVFTGEDTFTVKTALDGLVIGNIQVTDPEDGPLSLRITEVSDGAGALFALSGTTLVLSNAEMFTKSERTQFSLVIEAKDDHGNVGAHTFTVSRVASPPHSGGGSKGGTSSKTTASDKDGGGTFAWLQLLILFIGVGVARSKRQMRL